MVGHGNYPQVDEPDLPAPLSRRMTTDLLRGPIGFRGVAVSDDMEMHAVSDLGSYESLTERALMAGSDIILYCSHIERIPELQRHMDSLAKKDSATAARVAEAHKKAEAFRGHIDRLRQNARPPAASFDEVIDEAIRFIEKLEQTRPHREVFIPDSERRKQGRTPGKGRTGREEWT